jgi:signal transduction histidine kinase
MLKQVPPPTGDDSRTAAKRIQRLAAHAQALIADLLDLAKIEAQRFVVRLQPVDSRIMIEEALLGVAPLAEVKPITLSLELIDAPTLAADPDQILRVLTNLLGNAIKFTPPGGTVTVRAERSGPDLTITVADTGPGILADQLPWVFERYWQARPASQLGAGLGLYVARGIVEAHGGRIWAESSARGARLIFTLPL